jgi:hypothetical protein
VLSRVSTQQLGQEILTRALSNLLSTRHHALWKSICSLYFFGNLVEKIYFFSLIPFTNKNVICVEVMKELDISFGIFI